jgi:HD-GYP domain-containing protein (c-di-GMP phosphodiesterase class II)
MLKRKKIVQLKINSLFIEPHKNQLDSYILVDKRFFHIGDEVNFNLFFLDKPTHMSLFLQSDTVIDLKQKHKLRQAEQLFISKSKKERYDSFRECHIQNVLEDHSMSLDEKIDIIYESSTELTQSLYNNPNALENAQRSKNIVTPILQSILYHEDTISSYIKIIEYDYYTHTHSLNVSIYALCLGAELNLAEKTLTALGRSALLHDLGKSKIEHDIVAKTEELSQYEFERMKMHPASGYEIAVDIGIKSKDILDGIRHHHEKLNGMGYPDRLKDDEITLFPRIIGVCDVFDALTTKRSYKNAMSSYDALYLMKTEMHNHLDMHIVDVFIKMLHK